ncbi:MAG: SRPBCC family protein [Akkermansiaceae bacterium]|nr:SRPBCC family protein [Akkermansiaceae bacterium]
MKVHVLRQEQRLPISREVAWDFFSTPRNLAHLTPADAGFEVTYLSSERVHDGQIITYKAEVLPLFSMTWVTEIRCVEEGVSFVDEQLLGPYCLWHHRHTFEEIEGGVLVTDLVHYAMPMGIIGELARWLFVGKKLERVFDYRRKVLEGKFGTM